MNLLRKLYGHTTSMLTPWKTIRPEVFLLGNETLFVEEETLSEVETWVRPGVVLRLNIE